MGCFFRPISGALSLLCLGLLSATAAAASPGTAPDGVIVQWLPGSEHGDRVAAREAAGVAFAADLGNQSFQLVEVEPGQRPAAAVRELEQDPAVALAERDGTNVPSAVPNDPLFPQQWGLLNLNVGIRGQASAPGADIDAPGAWLRTVGAASVVVADLDSGYRFEHPDLAGAAWTNPGEAPGNGVDDDSDGIVDDVHGADFIGSNGQTPAIDGDPTDDDLLTGGHGTHTAGTIAATGGNGIGVTGVAQNVRLMPLRVCSRFPSSEDNRCLISAEVAAVNYAVAHGARVVNLSFSGNAPSQALINAIAAAPSTLFVAAAGNDRSNNDAGGFSPKGHHYPCDITPQTQAAPPVPGAVDNVVCVAATDQTDELAEFSDWGPTSVDLGAPGTAILSTYPFPARFEDSFGADDFGSRWVATGKEGGFERTRESPLSTYGITDQIGSPPAGSVRETTSPVFAVPPNAGCSFNQTGRIDLAPGDAYEIEVRLNGSSLGAIAPARTLEPGLEARSFPVAAAIGSGGQAHLRLRFSTGPSPFASSGVIIDDLSLTCAEPLGQASGYGFLEGTSTAAAHVSGTLALLLSMEPGASVEVLRSALLTTVDRNYAMSAKTTSGGRLNASRAVDYFDKQSPPAPGLSGTSPPSRSNENHPRVLGSSEEFSTVSIYSGASCAGAPTASGSAEELGSSGIEVLVENDTRNLFSARATDTAGNTSDCSPAVEYVERSKFCRVPRLVGRTLARARPLLRDADCKLGKVRRPKARKGRHPRLVIKKTLPHKGALPADDTVDVRLGAQPRSKRRHR